MECTSCRDKSCKVSAKDCRDSRDSVINEYKNDYSQDIYLRADSLTANGRAGKLSRIEELAEFIAKMGYKRIGIAYCFGIEKYASLVASYLTEKGFISLTYRCTLNGITENQICENEKDVISCNPIGQAQAINEDSVDFVIEMGLCLGHDVLFHQHLKVPFTVLVVKDRVFAHNPLEFFK